MIQRAVAWFRRVRNWNREHELAWAGWTSTDPGGLSRFQVACESAISSELSSYGLTLQGRTVAGAKDEARYIRASIGTTDFEAWIYVDGFEFPGPKIDHRFEEWDATTPQELLQAGMVVLRSLLSWNAESCLAAGEAPPNPFHEKASQSQAAALAADRISDES